MTLFLVMWQWNPTRERRPSIRRLGQKVNKLSDCCCRFLLDKPRSFTASFQRPEFLKISTAWSNALRHISQTEDRSTATAAEKGIEGGKAVRISGAEPSRSHLPGPLKQSNTTSGMDLLEHRRLAAKRSEVKTLSVVRVLSTGTSTYVRLYFKARRSNTLGRPQFPTRKYHVKPVRQRFVVGGFFIAAGCGGLSR